MDEVIDILVGTLKGLGKTKAKELGTKLRGKLNDAVAGTDPTFDDDLVEVVDAFVEGFGDDTATDTPASDDPA